MVFNTSGIHSVNMDYCECPKDDPLDQRTQLLRQSWFPATFTRPNTVFTFDCLNTFHKHTLQGKGNLYDFYHLLLQKTDNPNVSDTIVSKFLNLSVFFELIWLPSIATKRSIGSFEFGETLWHSNVQDTDMIRRVSERHLLVAWPSSVLHVRTQAETFQKIGRKLALLCA